MKKRLISWVLVLCMTISTLPLQVFATELKGKTDTSTSYVNPFADVNANDWFYSAVKYANENGIFGGTGKDAFEPNATMTRAMYVTVLGRIARVDTAAYKTTNFSDVLADSWYGPYVAWALEKGITKGTSDDEFSPEESITREQMATLTVKFFEAYKIAYQIGAPRTSVPKDLGDISSWAKDAALKLWQAGLLEGDAYGNFNPKDLGTRAEAATFSMRTDKTVRLWRGEEVTKEDTDKWYPGQGGTASYTVTFETNKGAALPAKTLTSGTKLDTLPTPYKLNSIFAGWYTDVELSEPLDVNAGITNNLTVYAAYTNSEGVPEKEVDPFVSKLDQANTLTIGITDTTGAMSADKVKEGLTYSCLTNPDYADIVVVSDGSGKFTVSGKGGFPSGSTNKLELTNEYLQFTGEDPQADIFTFTIFKAETLELNLAGSVKYIKATDVQKITANGNDVYSLSLPVLSVQNDSASSTLANGKADESVGTFVYDDTAKTIAVGDTVAMYEGTHPDERTLDGDYNKGNDVAYMKITAIEGNNYTYEKAQAQEVLFTPDVLPVPNGADSDGSTSNNSITVLKSVMTYTDDKYISANLDATTTIDVGDFIALYSGEFGANATDVKYGKITEVKTKDEGDAESYVVSYTDATMDEITAAMDIYDNKDVSGEQLLEGVDVAEIEESVKAQAIDSGFAEDAAKYLTAMALETDNFQSLAGDFDLSSYNITVADGAELPTGDMALMGAAIVTVKNLKIGAHIGTQLKHFENMSGLSCELTVSFDVVIKGDSIIVIRVAGTFVEEVRLSLNVSGGAVWKKAWIFPYIADYRLNANVDVFNYTGVKFDAKIGTFAEVPPLGSNDGWMNIADQMRDLLDAAEKGEVTGENGSALGGTLGSKYEEMMAMEGDWVELFSQSLVDVDSFIDPFHILCYGFSIDFVVSANMNLSIGFELMYENAKRYNFSLGLFSKECKSDTVIIKEEQYAFTFYVMGTIGVRAGIKMEVKVGLFSLKLDSIGLSAEVGAYVRLWGYFYYEVKWKASEGTRSRGTGALFLELGIYMEIKFKAQAFNGIFSYNPTLFDREWPLWEAGTIDNVQNFNYAQSSAPKVEMKNKTITATVSDSLFNMLYMNLKTGKMGARVYSDETQFDITMTNPAFEYDEATNTITLTPGKAIKQEGQMVITWKSQPLAFSSVPLTRKVDLDWENNEDVRVISFNSHGGTSINPIAALPEAGINKPQDPEKMGYVFDGWFTDSGYNTSYTVPSVMGKDDVTAHAKWAPATDTKYTVYHRQQNLWNAKAYDLIDTDELAGTTDASVTPERKTYEGFAQPSAKTATVLSDGSMVVVYDYARNSHTLTFSSGTQTDSADVVSTVKFGASVNQPKMASGGFIFGGWNSEPPETMPDRDVTITAKWLPDPNTPYRTEHYIKNVTDNNYTLGLLEVKTGTTNAEIVLKNSALATVGLKYEHGTVDAKVVDKTTIAPTGDRIIKIFYDREKYDFIYTLEGGTFPKTEYVFEAKTVQPNPPTKAGYAFSGWYAEQALQNKYVFGNKMEPRNVTVYGKFTPLTDTKYTVKHHLENLDGNFTLAKSTDKTGATDAKLTLAEGLDTTYATPAGFAYANAKVGTAVKTETNILSNGSLVIDLYYKRQSYTLTFKPENSEADTVKSSQKFGATLTAPIVSKTGYVFGGWSPIVPSTVPAGDTTYTAQWNADTNTAYKVKHYQQNTTGANYTLVETETLNGVTGTTVQATLKSYPHFNYNAEAVGSLASGAIEADGSLVLSVYYDRAQYTVSYEVEGTALGSPASYRHGANVIHPTAPVKIGYDFSGWLYGNEIFNGIMPTENITLVAKFSIGEASYKVQHFVMDTTGKYPETVSSEHEQTIVGKPDIILTLAALKLAKFEVANGIAYLNGKVDDIVTTETAIKADGSLVIKLYYERKGYYLVWYLAGGTAADGTAGGSTYYDAAIVAPTMSKSYYTFTGWKPAVLGKMPAEGQSYTAQWDPMVYTVSYYDQGGGAFSGRVSSGASDKLITEYTYGTSHGIPYGSNIERANYKFLGWYTDVYCNGNEVKFIGSSEHGNKNFYAKWEANKYTVSYVLDNGTNNSANPIEYTFSESVPLMPATKNGMAFGGWYNNRNLTGDAVTSITATDFGDKTFWAKWVVPTYTVTFVGEQGVPAAQTFTKGTAKALTNYSGSKTGHTFAGWATVQGGAVVYTNGESITATADMTLYSVWNPTTYAINYVVPYGFTLPTSGFPRSYTYGSSDIFLTDSVGTVDGFTFDGWYSDQAFTTPIVLTNAIVTATSSADVTVYAKATMTFTDIGTEAELKAWRENIEKSDVAAGRGYKLTADIAITPYTWKTIERTFMGVLDFNGFSISNLDTMMFRCIGESGSVKKLYLKNVKFTQESVKPYVGALAGELRGGTVTGRGKAGDKEAPRIAVEGQIIVTQRDSIAGCVVGYNNGGTVGELNNGLDDISIKLQIDASKVSSVHVGGIAGKNENGKIYGSKFYQWSGAVGYNYTIKLRKDEITPGAAGGVAGISLGTSEIANCQGADIDGNIENAGGIVGVANGKLVINKCIGDNGIYGSFTKLGGAIGWAAGEDICVKNTHIGSSLFGTDWIGGIIGYADGTGKLQVLNCAYNGNLKSANATNKVGGLFGYISVLNANRIENCAVTNDVRWRGNAGGEPLPVGMAGLVGTMMSGTLKQCFWYNDAASANGAIRAGGNVDNRLTISIAPYSDVTTPVKKADPIDLGGDLNYVSLLKYTGNILEQLNKWVEENGSEYTQWVITNNRPTFKK